MSTLQSLVRHPWVHAANKHGLHKGGETLEEYADKRINELSNAEFLERISEALDEIIKELKS